MKNPKSSENLDPLYVIFEQHLLNFEDSDMNRKAFVEAILRDYFRFLSRAKIIVPKSLEHLIVEELSEQIQTMLTKKIYGCLNILDYQKKIPAPARKRAKHRYQQLQARLKSRVKDAA